MEQPAPSPQLYQPGQQQLQPADQQGQQQSVSHYQQTQPLSQPQAQRIRPVHVSSRGMWASKLSLRLASIVSALVLIGVTAQFATADNILPILEFGPPAVIAIVWNLAESICLCVRGGHRGIHPGAIVAIDLLLWLGYIVSIVFLGLFGISESNYYDYFDYGDSYDYSISTFSSTRTIFAFGIIEILLHITLFIIACYETSVRNKNTQIVYVQSNAGAAVMYPPNLQMAQVYQQPGYPQPPMPVQQQYGYQMPPQGQLKTETPPTVAAVYQLPTGQE